MTKLRDTVVTVLTIGALFIVGLVALPYVDDIESHKVSLTAVWRGVKPEHVTYTVDGHERPIDLKGYGKNDKWNITLTDHVGATYAVEVYVGDASLPRDVTYGCTITYGDGREQVVRAGLNPPGVRCEG